MQEEVINQSDAKSKFLVISIIILVIAIIAIAILGLYFLFNDNEDGENNVISLSPNDDNLDESGENTSLIIQNDTVNETIDVNDTDSGNESDIVDLGDFVPNPYGDISLIDYRNSGEYSCNQSGVDNPRHGLRLYSYRLIEGVKTFSQDYIEFDNTDKICDGYGNLEDGELIIYYIDWIWDPVIDVDGYRAFQYYTQENITRIYTHYLDTKNTKITDTKRGLWVRGELPISDNDLNSTDQNNTN